MGELRFVAIYALFFGDLWAKKVPFWVKTVLLGQEVHYYMVYIAYFTELNSKILDYAQKRRICCENCKYALDERFHGHFCPRRKPAKSCHPVLVYFPIIGQFLHYSIHLRYSFVSACYLVTQSEICFF